METRLNNGIFLSLLLWCAHHMTTLYQSPNHSQSIYEPGKRHWLKVKKDYLEGGAMADTADLIVLGGYYGTGNKGHNPNYLYKFVSRIVC